MAELNVGDRAPDFKLPSTIDNEWSLSSAKGQKSVLLSVHVFDFTGDLYGKSLRVALVDFIRPEMKFSGLDQLKAQIAADGQAARAILSA